MINIFAKKITSNDLKVIERIKAYFIKQLGENIKFEIIDVINHPSPIVENYSILCGNIDYLLEFHNEIYTIKVASLDTILSKEKAHFALGEFNKLIQTYNSNKDNKIENNNFAAQQNYIEKNKIKLGNTSICDIKITEKEAEYLKKIKDLLDGSKIIITKGDLKLEIQ